MYYSTSRLWVFLRYLARYLGISMKFLALPLDYFFLLYFQVDCCISCTRVLLDIFMLIFCPIILLNVSFVLIILCRFFWNSDIINYVAYKQGQQCLFYQFLYPAIIFPPYCLIPHTLMLLPSVGKALKIHCQASWLLKVNIGSLH